MRKLIIGLLLVLVAGEVFTDEIFVRLAYENSKDVAGRILRQLFQSKEQIQKIEENIQRRGLDEKRARKERDDGEKEEDDEEASSGQCPVCKDIMYRIDILSQYSKQETFAMIVDKVCQKMVEEYRDQCEELIENHREDIVQAFMDGESSKDICSTMKICSDGEENDKLEKSHDHRDDHHHHKNDHHHHHHKDDHHHHHHDIQCKICTKKVRKFERLFNHSQSAETVQKIFIATCDITKPDIQSKCIQFYKTKGFQAIKEILKGVKPKKICQDLKFCKGRREQSELLDLFNDGHLFMSEFSKIGRHCKSCVKRTQFYENMMDPSKTLEFVVQRLSAICTLYKTKYQKYCQEFFKSPKIQQYLKSILAKEDAMKICKDAGVCHKKENSPSQLSELGPISKKKGHMFCKTCTGIVHLYEIVLDHTRKPEDVQKVFNGTCDVLKIKMKKKCNNFYEHVGFDAIKDMLKNVNPLKICRDLTLCGKKRENSENSFISSDIPTLILDVSKAKKNCVICVKITKYYEKIVNNSITLDAFISKMANVCTVYQAKFQPQCQGYFKNPKVLQYYKSILAHECPLKICKDIGACKKKEESLAAADFLFDETAFLPRFNIL